MTHGNYKQITHREAYEKSIEHHFTLVGVDSIVYRNGRGIGRIVQHIVTSHDFYTQDEPQGYSVELARPPWLYGSEGQLFPIEFVGRLCDEWLDVHEEDWFPQDDPFPDCSDFLWALPNRMYHPVAREDQSVPWRHVDWDIYTVMRVGDRS